MNLSYLRQKPHLSASSIGDYLDCGMLYKFGRVDRLPRQFVADAMEFGTVIHAVLAEYYQAKMTGDRMLLKTFMICSKISGSKPPMAEMISNTLKARILTL